ncbi:hypothetical protein LOD99_15624 [Oopsacas minuta]|uniref:AMMECR1 domain-containing protein n=1 Tax=Oopsacas minuta TaxID=111878 RepID=A0AAV7K971_9METZ|nr:hypothetical protein LOD99_15624 [Oopsacas minuta]
MQQESLSNHSQIGVKECEIEGASPLPNHIERILPQNSVISSDMCYFCFDVLIAYLYKQDVGYIPSFTDASFPLFVTWKIGHEGKLRGCIGTFDPLPLHKGLRDYCIKSSMEDNRFHPVTLAEVHKLECSVSLLTNFTPGGDCYDWEIGVHGITIEFFDGFKKKRKATYLPEVALEQGWDRIETINSLLKKGGLKGAVTQPILDSISLTRYQTEKCRVTHNEYLDLWHNKNI